MFICCWGKNIFKGTLTDGDVKKKYYKNKSFKTNINNIYNKKVSIFLKKIQKIKIKLKTF